MEKIAIIGMGCRFPGSENPESFWQILSNKIDAVSEISSREFDLNILNDYPIVPTAGNNRLWGGFLQKVDYFDPSFFQISSREAERMDPQQRLFLEVAWESLENAGIVPSSELSGSKTGVFVGVGSYDYGMLLSKKPTQINAYNAVGTNLSIIANRLSYLLNLKGPSLIIDAACSSSLVALHYACQSLQTGESNLCLAAGVNLILSPERAISLAHAQMIAADGRCKTFDAGADGYVQGEGCGVVVLKRLADALRDGDNIQAIIRGSAVNHNGLSNGLLAPNGRAQQVVIRQALANAEVEPDQISYVETQAIGMALGDSIEVNALKAVLMEGREQNQPCWIGSVKTNIGHLEGAAGMAGLIKVVLSLQHGEIPPHLHLKKLNPYIKIENTPIQIPIELQEWPATEQPRLAGVSAFSFGGTNAHVVLEEAQIQVKNQQSIVNDQNLSERSLHLLTLSAKTETALFAIATRYQHHLETHPNQALADICFTANKGREHFDHRLAVVVESREHLIKQLAAFAAGNQTTRVISAEVVSKNQPKIAFLFSDQGFEYVNMGRQLYDSQPSFRKTLEYCAQILHLYLEHSLLEVLYPSQARDHVSSLLKQTAYTQPALFVLEYALYQLWKSWGIEPDIVMGHDVGEYVAACVAGVFSLEDALKLIAHQASQQDDTGTQGRRDAKQKQVAEEISYSQPHIKVIVNGKLANSEIATAQYWVEHRQSSGKFADSLATLQELGVAVFVEIGPKPKCLPKDAGLWLPSLSGDIPDWQQLLKSLAQLYVRGVAIDWSGFDRDYPRNKVVLPTYPFERQRYWIEKSNSQAQKTKAEFRTRLAAANANERRQLLINHVRSQVAKVIGSNVSETIDLQQGFFELGMDSLTVLELRNSLQKSLGCSLPSSVTFTYPTVAKLVDYLAKEVLLLDSLNGKSQTTDPEQVVTNSYAEDLSDSEAEALLLQKLESINYLKSKIMLLEAGQSISPMKRALGAVEQMQAKLEAVENAKKEPLAIVGMGCRFPGDANNPEAFWQLLRDGVDAVTEVPRLRWDIDAFYDPDPDAPGKIYTRYGAFVSQLEEFDPQFFSISPREVASLDPQQRLLLEVSWEALENAAIKPNQLVDSRTGVFIGICSNDYLQRLLTTEVAKIDSYHGTGNAHSVAAGRLSYILGLTGPSLAVDTACSSSLVAVHLACQSLRNRECDLALAGGVNLLISPLVSINFSKARMLSADGRCKTFDAAADGYVRGEGCGVIVLKRLSDAIKDKDNILALIRGSAINQDGRSSGLTVPNGTSQQTVICQALENGGVEPSQVSYIEAHGTGTSLGDPIEVDALSVVFGKNRLLDQPLVLGSVKTNMGHLEAAAGIAGLIKVVLQMQHQEIAPHLHFHHPSPHISWEDLPFKVPTQRTHWQTGEKTRLAGVSSFSFSGTNAHVVLEQAPTSAPVTAPVELPLHLLTLSAKTPSALEALANSYQNYIQTHSDLPLRDICYTANTGREHFDRRLAIVVDSREQLVEQLAAFTAGKDTTGLIRSQPNKKSPKIAFLFTGQGSQYMNMGRQLYDSQPIFRQTIEQCNEILRSYLEDSLLDVLYPQELGKQALLDQTALTQPALFAFEYALYQVWKSWGIEPDAVMGHSVGEYVAATVAGVFSLEDGLKLIADRGRLMQQLPAGGEMVSLIATPELVKSAIAPFHETVALAAINGPESVVISGAGEDIAVICQQLESLGVKTKRLQVSHAFHSPLMAPMLKEFEQVANQVTYNQPLIPLVSNVTGQLVDQNITKAQYWVNHVRQAVQFAQSMETLHELGLEVFLEIGPQPILLGMGRQCLANSNSLWLPSMRVGLPEWQQLLSSLGELYVAGVAVDWSGMNRDDQLRKVVLPTYPFQRQRYWIENTPPQHQQQHYSKKLHPLVEKKFQSPLSKEIWFESDFSTETLPFLADYLVYNQVVVPAASHLSLLLGAAKLTFGSEACLLENIVFPQALVIQEGKVRKVQLVLCPEDNGTSFQLISFDTATDSNTQVNQWQVHGTGRISKSVNTLLETISIQEIQARCTRQIAGGEIYQDLQKRQIELGPSFQWLDCIWCGEGEALAQMKWLSIEDGVEDYQLYPGLIDSCLQLVSIFLPPEDTFVPFAIESFRFYQRPQTQQLWCHGRRRPPENPNNDKLIADIKLFDASGQVIAEIQGFEAKKATRELLLHSLHQDVADWLYEIDWQAVDKVPSAASLDGSWLIFTDPLGLGQQLAEQLQQQGALSILVSAGVSYEKIDQYNYQIDPSQLEHFQKLLYELESRQPLSIIHLWSLQPTAPREPDYRDLETTELRNCSSVLHLVQALGPLDWKTQPHLWLVTQATQAVTAAPVQLSGSSLWGLGRVIALEHPELECKRLDLSAQATREDNVQALLLEVAAPDAEDQIAFRQNRRYVAQLMRHKAIFHKQHIGKVVVSMPQMSEKAAEGQLSIQPEASYLIAGGLGALGLEVAGWLVEKGAQHLVLTGRHEPSPGALERIAALEQTGARVLVTKADVSQVDQVVEVLEKIQSSLPPLRGIIHGAGVLDDGVLLLQSQERFERVMAPKVQGAWNLHSLTKHLPLEFFVCFSSISSVMGASGQGNYAAANAFMDSLAHYRSRMGLPGLSINWGPWSQVGMAAKLDSRDLHRMQAMGMSAIAPEQGLMVLEQLLNQSSAQVAVIPINWSEFISQSTIVSPFFANFTNTKANKVEKSEFLARLEAAKIDERRQVLIDHICSQVAKVVGWNLSETIDLQQGFSELGMDSLTAMELRNSLQKSLGCSLPSSLAFDYPTVIKLVDYLAKEVLLWDLTVEVNKESQSSVHKDVVTKSYLEDLSDNEVTALLLKKLESIRKH